MRPRAVLGISTLLAFAGCTLSTDYFSDYRGENLLANYDFDALKADAVTPQWAIESYTLWSDNTLGTYDATYSPDDYVTWEPAADLSGVGDGSVANLAFGPDGASPAYRLEVKNLFTNGDFENQTNGAGFDAPDSGWWTLSAAGTAEFGDTADAFTSIVTIEDFSPISSRSLFFSGTTSGNRLAVDLDATTSVPLWDRPGSYQFRFDFRYASNTGALTVNMDNQSGSTIDNTEAAGNWNVTGLEEVSSTVPIVPSTVVSLSKFFTNDGGGTSSTVTIGSDNSQEEAVIDNVRVVQNDVPPFVIASFSSLNSGSLKLLPGAKAGAYKLMFWVHDDPTADQTGGSGIPHTANRFRASGVTVQVTAAVKSGSGTFVQFIPRPSSGWTTWTQLTFSMGFDFVNSDAALNGNPALTLKIAPTNTEDLSTGGRDAGSLLVTQPAFTFNP